MKASREGETAIAVLLLNKHADIDALFEVSVSRMHDSSIHIYMVPQQTQSSALHEAARRAHKDVVELLVEKGANIELRDKVKQKSYSPLKRFWDTSVHKKLHC